MLHSYYTFSQSSSDGSWSAVNNRWFDPQNSPRLVAVCNTVTNRTVKKSGIPHGILVSVPPDTRRTLLLLNPRRRDRSSKVEFEFGVCELLDSFDFQASVFVGHDVYYGD